MQKCVPSAVVCGKNSGKLPFLILNVNTFSAPQLLTADKKMAAGNLFFCFGNLFRSSVEECQQGRPGGKTFSKQLKFKACLRMTILFFCSSFVFCSSFIFCSSFVCHLSFAGQSSFVRHSSFARHLSFARHSSFVRHLSFVRHSSSLVSV